MADFERTLLGCLFTLFIGVAMLTLARAILRRRPVVIAPTTMAGVLTLPFLLGLIANTVGLIMGSLNSDFAVMSSALSSLVLLLILVGFFAIVAAQYFYLYNITETMLRDALHSALQKQGLLYSEPEPGFFCSALWDVSNQNHYAGVKSFDQGDCAPWQCLDADCRQTPYSKLQSTDCRFQAILDSE